jgi:hypothetical protein
MSIWIFQCHSISCSKSYTAGLQGSDACLQQNRQHSEFQSLSDLQRHFYVGCYQDTVLHLVPYAMTNDIHFILARHVLYLLNYFGQVPEHDY